MAFLEKLYPLNLKHADGLQQLISYVLRH